MSSVSNCTSPLDDLHPFLRKLLAQEFYGIPLGVLFHDDNEAIFPDETFDRVLPDAAGFDFDEFGQYLRFGVRKTCRYGYEDARDFRGQRGAARLETSQGCC